MGEPANRAAINAVCGSPLEQVALDRRRVTENLQVYSLHLSENRATAQMKSGRCWIFAGLNMLRYAAIRNMGLDNSFEFSQNYVYFWFKLEQANFVLQAAQKSVGLPDDDRTVGFLLQEAASDAGQWHVLKNLVEKYGLVPKGAMPETVSSCEPWAMNEQLQRILRSAVGKIRRDPLSGPDVADGALATVFRLLCVHLGMPPDELDTRWRDQSKNFRKTGPTTPLQFYRDHVGVELGDYVRMMHDPRPRRPFGWLYEFDTVANVVGGDPLTYLNCDLSQLKSAALSQLRAGEPVLFGADVRHSKSKDLGMFDTKLFDLSPIYGERASLTKGQRLAYRDSVLAHAMVLTGADESGPEAVSKWRVENSWGSEAGDRGFFLMTDEWFDEHVFEVVAHRRFVPESILGALGQPPIPLPAWDSLA